MKTLCVVLAAGAFAIGFGTTAFSADCNLCGDVDGSGFVDISDVVAFVEWMYDPDHPTPACPNCADVDCDGGATAKDIDYLMDYIFNNGPAPCDPDGDDAPDCSCS